ncbi:hypothetical protein F5Y13DRAFT_204294 [Hypoxylon sp. FL1857]|nr:hypothetical protein F5Y13DRAFT_204294 [Hypoxylon sp. FL1857]
MNCRLKVMRKRRGRSLRKKLVEYADLFNVDVALIVQDKKSGEYEVFQPTYNKNWPPAMKDITPAVLHIGRKGKTSVGHNHKIELRRMEKLVLQSKVPKPPKSKN